MVDWWRCIHSCTSGRVPPNTPPADCRPNTNGPMMCLADGRPVVSCNNTHFWIRAIRVAKRCEQSVSGASTASIGIGFGTVRFFYPFRWSVPPCNKLVTSLRYKLSVEGLSAWHIHVVWHCLIRTTLMSIYLQSIVRPTCEEPCVSSIRQWNLNRQLS